jgi:hypothetical protein
LTILLILAWEMLSILSNPVMLTPRCSHLFNSQTYNITHKVLMKKLLQVPFTGPCPFLYMILGKLLLFNITLCQTLVIVIHLPSSISDDHSPADFLYSLKAGLHD